MGVLAGAEDLAEDEGTADDSWEGVGVGVGVGVTVGR